ncbi:MAG: hypothetical protein ACTH2Q_10770 [Propionibacteriaceae bacterium]
MGLQLPSELIDVLAMLGMTWPEADEELLFERAGYWMDFSTAADEQRSAADEAVAKMLAENSSPGLERFDDYWDRVAGDWGHMNGSSVTAGTVAVAYYAAAGLVLAMKIAVIVQLIALAIALAAAAAASFVTLGSSVAAAAAYARTVFTIIQRIVQGTITAIQAYGPMLAQVVGALAEVGTLALDSRPIHDSADGRDGPETDAERDQREQAREARLDQLSGDPAHGGKTTPGSEREAEVGLSLEETGALDGPITRDPSGSAEFIDDNGQKWDVKGFQTRSGKGGYDPAKAAAKIERELAAGHNVILDLKKLQEPDLSNLKDMVRNNSDWAGKVIIY